LRFGSPGGAQVLSQGREPLDRNANADLRQPRTGRQTGAAPKGNAVKDFLSRKLGFR
jgi:hypothetical protein